MFVLGARYTTAMGIITFFVYIAKITHVEAGDRLKVHPSNINGRKLSIGVLRTTLSKFVKVYTKTVTKTFLVHFTKKQSSMDVCLGNIINNYLKKHQWTVALFCASFLLPTIIKECAGRVF